MKRLFDVCVSIMLILILFPLIMVVALLVKMGSSGPVFFMQDRVGLNGRLFKMYKFRSMVANAESQGPYFTSTGDPRITKIGRFIRKTSLDELPQLFNVLLGDMSLVGPRPNVMLQKKDYIDQEWNKRNSVRPGITGLAQAKLRSAATPKQRTMLDLEYVDKASVIFDIWIILLTIKQVLTKGSH
jgi:lipopolysaccharide/colanic/teichoic acid biosynthesis glycosyltransferase